MPLSLPAIHVSISASEVRLAHWLLMAHDRSDGDEPALTHDYMAVMLAVRRPSVTTALHLLEGNRLVRARAEW